MYMDAQAPYFNEQQAGIMTQQPQIQIIPYTKIVGQEDLKLALEVAYIAPRIGGVLISGHRGTGKSTTVRAFAQMMHGDLPVTLPINATEDRVVGGWQIDELMRGKPKKKKGLLEEANGQMLYIDEVNLLDDHIVNIILDVSATGVLVVQREGRDDAPKEIRFTLVGTMNPEEGDLRPQLLDRFGLVVNVQAETSLERRGEILQTVLAFDEALAQENSAEHSFIKEGLENDAVLKGQLHKARDGLYSIEVPTPIAQSCVSLAKEFRAVGHRGDYVMALAARALAEREAKNKVEPTHVQRVAALALQHRRPGQPQWAEADDEKVAEILNNV